jgi:tripartite-type tricarboxylate transporter receptor subunit TctC
MDRRQFALSLCVVPLAASRPSPAQTFPSRPLRLVVPFPPGGVFDSAARLIGERVGQLLGQPVVVDNRSGASGLIGSRFVAGAAPDGHTMVLFSTPTLLAPYLSKVEGFDAFTDLRPVAGTFDLPLMMVVNPVATPDVRDLAGLIRKAKAQPGALNYSTSNNGSFGHASTELLKSLGDFDLHHIPYRGMAAALNALLAGDVQMVFADTSALPFIRADRLRVIAAASSNWTSFTPDVKSIAQQGFPGFEATTWGGILVHAQTPEALVSSLSEAFRKTLEDPGVQERLQIAGLVASYLTPDQFGARMRSDADKWGRVIRERNITQG